MKPIAFRIKDFRSIKDSGVCELSGDGITVLAGQNESGKTAVLTALRDFDLSPGDTPKTPEFLPEGDDEAMPEVSVQFALTEGELARIFMHDVTSPTTFVEFYDKAETLWITRDLTTNHFRFEPEVTALWDGYVTNDSQAEDEEEREEYRADEGDTDEGNEPFEVLSAQHHADMLFRHWPQFVYFDSFSDTLPRSVPVGVLVSAKEVPPVVADFLLLAEVDAHRLVQLAKDPKQIGNYLNRRSAVITGDFLTYWKQRVGENSAIELHARSFHSDGMHRLAFFVRDRVDQYPDQRSKGFLWFLSFYLRLTAAGKKSPGSKRVLLVDEPGSYLHARAQRDILHLFGEKLTPAGQQILYTTHSPYLLPAEGLHRVRLVVKDEKQGTMVLDRLTHPAVRGDVFADTLSPVLTSIGLDIQETLSFVRPMNLLVEGITDHIYLTRWASEFSPELLKDVNIFPCFGAPTIHTLASLFVGWGLPFAVLTDRDSAGEKAKERLHRDLLVPRERMVQPKDAVAIEDLFSADDFRKILQSLDPSLNLLSDERPSSAIERQRIDKVLLARRFSELHVAGLDFTGKTRAAIQRLLKDILTAVHHVE